MTYYTSWISDEELLEILEEDPLVFQSTLDVLRGDKKCKTRKQAQMQCGSIR